MKKKQKKQLNNSSPSPSLWDKAEGRMVKPEKSVTCLTAGCLIKNTGSWKFEEQVAQFW